MVFGSKAKLLSSETIMDKCPSCGQQGSVQLHVYQKYAHIYWIPIFPTKKIVNSQCGHCKQVLDEKQMLDSFANALVTLKANAKAPKYLFAGSAVLVVLIVALFIGISNDNKENLAFITAPQKGDVYEVKTGTSQYTLYKVEKLEGDSVFVKMSEFEADKLSGLSKIKSKGSSVYAADNFGFSKNELKQMLEKNEIIDVDRN